MPTSVPIDIQALADTAMPGALLERLAFPRPNGSAALDAAHAILDSALTASGVPAQSIAFPCQAERPVIVAGVVACVVVFLALAAWRRARLWTLGAIGFAAVAWPAATGALDTWLARTPERQLLVHVEPRATAVRHLLLTAHYDTKTEWLDHVGRSLLFGSAIVALGATLAVALWRPSRLRLAGTLTALLCAACAVQLTIAPSFGSRSPGVLDDAGACALLVDLVATYTAAPLQDTRLTCVWFAGEEVGAQGSTALAATLAATDVTDCINLEVIGAGPDLVVSRYEMHGARVLKTSAVVRDRVARAAGTAVRDLPWPIWTDAGPLLSAGVPALTLLTMPAGSTRLDGLHSARDNLARFDPSGYVRARDMLRRYLEASDTP